MSTTEADTDLPSGRRPLDYRLVILISAVPAVVALVVVGVILFAVDRTPEPDRQLEYRSTPQGDLTLDIFEPAAETSDPTAALVLFHGGGWQFGEPERMAEQARHFADLGLVSISVEYRTEERHGTTPFDAMQDGIAALRWLRTNAEELGIDPERIAAGGSSAGAQIAAIASTHGVGSGLDDDPSASVSARPDALVLIEPVYDNSPSGYGNDRLGENWQELSPLHTLRSDMAPAIVFFGSDDALTSMDSAEAFRDGMLELGVRSELTIIPGGTHGFLNAGTSGAERVYDEHLAAIEAFLRSLGWFD